MTWQILLFFSIFLFSLNGLFHRSLMKDVKSDPKAQTVVFLGLAGIFAIIIAFIRGHFNLVIPLMLLPNFAILVLLSTLAPILTFKAYQLITASEVVIFLSTQRLWNVFGASIFLGETITTNKIFGTIIILIGIAITLYGSGKFKLNKGILFSLIAALLYGLGDINGFYVLRSVDASTFQIYAELLPVLALLLIQPKAISKIGFYFKASNALKISLATLFDVLATLSLFFAYQLGRNASQIGPLSATKVILTVIFAAIILKEKDHLAYKIFGAIVTVVGAILLF